MGILSRKLFGIAPDFRPCMVNGRRAIFHRWADSARPVAPRGVEENETAQRYQLHSVFGIVEYEDGTVDRVWPYEIQFIDHSEFDAYAWPEENLQYE